MRGFPKHLNTKQDFLNLKDDYSDQVLAVLERLLDDRMQWLNIRTLGEKDQGVEDETHMVIGMEQEIITGEDGAIAERYQYEYTEDPNARLFRLGFGVEEAEKFIMSIGG
jgi:hypothetical protein